MSNVISAVVKKRDIVKQIERISEEECWLWESRAYKIGKNKIAVAFMYYDSNTVGSLGKVVYTEMHGDRFVGKPEVKEVSCAAGFDPEWFKRYEKCPKVCTTGSEHDRLCRLVGVKAQTWK